MQYLVASALVAYAAGFLVTFAWARSLQRRHALDDRRAAVAPALLGGALGGICVLLIFATSQAGLLAR